MARGIHWIVVATSALVACSGGEAAAPVRDVPDAPFALEWIGPPSVRGDDVAFAARFRNRSNRRIERLSVTVRVLDERGATVDAMVAAPRALGWMAIEPGERRTWELYYQLLDHHPVMDLAHVEITPRSAHLCDGSTWDTTRPSVPPNPMLRACARDLPYRGPAHLDLRDGRAYGAGFSFAVPDGYRTDERYAGSIMAPDAEMWIGVLHAPSEWIDLDPRRLDADRCRDLLLYDMYTGSARLDVQHVSGDVTTCARYLGGNIQEIVVAARGDDFQILCAYPELAGACLEVAASWRLEHTR